MSEDLAWARLPSLTGLRAFAVAARYLSFSKAATVLHVSPSAVSHQIRALEEQLGHSLFVRARRGLALTESGRVLLPGIEEGLIAQARALSLLTQAGGRPTITVSVPPSVATKWLVPRLSGPPYPWGPVDVRLSSDLDLPDLSRNPVDLAIHYGAGAAHTGMRGRATRTDVMSELLVANAVAPMCAPSLLDGDPPLREPADLRRFTLLHDIGEAERDTTLYDWRAWLERLGVSDVDASRGLRFNTSADVLSAAAAGAGVAIGKTALGIDDLRAGRLVCLFDTAIPEPLGYHLYYTKDSIGKPEVAAFRDWLVSEFSPERRQC